MKWTLEEEQALMQILKGKSSPTVTYSEMGKLKKNRILQSCKNATDQ